MNDNELTATVRASVADVHSSTPVDQIVSRGRTVRGRRRMPIVAGAVAVAGGAALAVTAVVPAGHSTPLSSSRAGHAAVVRLAAWTVVKQANGQIDITVKQLQDPARLQATLRADGLPVTVSFSGPHFSPACRAYDGSRDVLRSVAHFRMSGGSDVLTINPSALPSGTGVAIFDEPGKSLPSGGARPVGTTAKSGNSPLRGSVHPPAGLTGPLAVGLVSASPQCTG